MTSLRRK